jgi:hypothetical protein
MGALDESGRAVGAEGTQNAAVRELGVPARRTWEKQDPHSWAPVVGQRAIRHRLSPGGGIVPERMIDRWLSIHT